MNNYLKLFQNKNKLAFVVGGHGLIGKEVCKALLSSGCKVIVLDIKSKKNSLLKKQFYNHYLDCSKLKTLKVNIDKIIKKYGTPKIFINCSYPKSHDWLKNSFKDITEKSYKYNIDVHLNSFVWLAKYLADSMKRKKIKGSIINITSLGAELAFPNNPAYHAAKGAVRLLTKSAAIQYASFGIRVNSVHPGYADTPMTEPIFNKKDLESRLNRVPMGRLGTADEIAMGILYLASDESSFITGSELVIDGGMTAQ